MIDYVPQKLYEYLVRHEHELTREQRDFIVALIWVRMFGGDLDDYVRRLTEQKREHHD